MSDSNDRYTTPPDPDRFDIHRRMANLRTFGFGTHYCLGASLARLEAKVALEEFLRETFPTFSERPILQRWAGIMAFTEDHLPLVGEVPDVPGAYYAAGFSGHGLSLGFVTGRHLARRALGLEEGELFPAAC